MKRVLVLGAGMVAPPLVDYLLEKFQLTLSDVNRTRADALLKGHPHGCYKAVDVLDHQELSQLISQHDVVVSLLPPPLHPKVGQACLEAQRHLVTASYISQEMAAMDDAARRAGLMFLNEMGLDPGLDHMMVMEALEEIGSRAGVVESFQSHAGGLPSRAAATRPLRYKFSWNPAGVLSALTRPSRYRMDGRDVRVDGPENLTLSTILHLPGIGVFESNPNADSLLYAEKYGIASAGTLRRATLRFPGWGAFWTFMLEQGLMDSRHTLACKGLPGHRALALACKTPCQDLALMVQQRGGSHASAILEVLDDLGLFEKTPLEEDLTAFEIILKQASARWTFAANERDWVVMVHDFEVRFEQRREKIRSSLIREGDAATTAMAALVGLPAAIGVRLVLEEAIGECGVLDPMRKSIYRPVLAEMKALGFGHTVETIPL
jgi:saccharopine dehydrogenase-like NADP-dependent oxidoreductase